MKTKKEEKIKGFIYKITNMVDGKVYIGQTIKNPRIRFRVHLRGDGSIYLGRASKKYGKDNFKCEIIASAVGKSNIDYLEQYFIKKLNTIIPKGYNVQSGGAKTTIRHKNTVRKISIRSKLRKESKLKGVKFSKEHVNNLSKSRKGFTSYNRTKALKDSIRRKRKPIKCIDIKTGYFGYFNSKNQCARYLDLQEENIYRVLNNKQNRSQHKGFKFEYLSINEYRANRRKYRFSKKKLRRLREKIKK